MFQFPPFAYLAVYMSFTHVGCPIRKSPDQWPFAPTRSLSQLITSFFASESQGIRHAPLLTFFMTRLRSRISHTELPINKANPFSKIYFCFLNCHTTCQRSFSAFVPVLLSFPHGRFCFRSGLLAANWWRITDSNR